MKRLRVQVAELRNADVALAGVLLVLGMSQVWLGWNDGGIGVPPQGQQLARAVLVVGVTVPLAARRHHPLAVNLMVCAALVVQVLLVAPYAPFLPALLALLIVNYSTAVYAPNRVRGLGLLAVFAVETVFYLRIPEERVGGEVVFAVVVAVGTWVVGDLVRSRWRGAEALADSARSLVAEQDARASAILAGERSRIARELHDVIAHSVSVMGVQAGAARVLLEGDPKAAREALLEIEATARFSVLELQRMVTILRAADSSALREPQPGLAQVPELIERVRAAGLPVTLTVEGPAPRLAPGVDLAAYRIAQEALTNALKHAQAPTSVRICFRDNEVKLEVLDDGSDVTGSGPGGGHGLVGMRERVLLYGGTLEVGPRPDRGYRVAAMLPVTVEGAR